MPASDTIGISTLFDELITSVTRIPEKVRYPCRRALAAEGVVDNFPELIPVQDPAESCR